MSNIKYINSNSEILNVYFGNYDACVVDSYTYDVMYKLNPAIEKNLKILEISPKIFSNLLVLFNNRNNNNDLLLFQEKLNTALNDTRKNDLFDLMKINDIKIFPIEHSNNMKSFYNEFKALKKKYN